MPKRGRSASEQAPIDWRAALTLYKREGWTFARIARHYGVHYRTAWKNLRALGAERRTSPAWHSDDGRHIYEAWRLMRQRCIQKRSPHFHYYGARGIRICDAWLAFEPFYRWALRSGWKPGRTLALIDRDRNFAPENCRWIGKRERDRNRRLLPRAPPQSGLMVTAFGETKNIADWALDARCKVSKASLTRRLHQGIAAKVAITTLPRTRWDPPLRKARTPLEFVTRPEIDWNLVVQMHRDVGLSAGAIASELGLPYQTIHSGLRRRGVFERSVGQMTAERHRLYLVWRSLWARTTNPRHELYPSTGAVGIRVCNEWADFEPFYRWALASGSKPQHFLERIQRRGDYSPTNCRWVPRSEAISHAMKRLGARVRR